MNGPTQGAEKRQTNQWAASPGWAMLVRVVIFAVPVLTAWITIRLLAGHLYRPSGLGGLGVWALQAIAVTSLAALVADRLAGRFLPLATVLGLSLTFPDQAPSRFALALRTGTMRKLEAKVAQVNAEGLSKDTAAAAREAVSLVTMLSRHERFTRGHTERVRAYCDLIAIEMGLSEKEREKLAWAALLHDIGKLSVRPEVLNKNGRPDAEEWEELKGHPKAGEEFIAPLRDWLGDWALATSQHHERWDGGGYPYGLKNTEISVAGRIVAVADAYDVITSKRSYKVGLPVETARRELVACSGSQFDPAVVRAFLRASLSQRRLWGPFAWLLELPGLPGVIHGVTAVPTSIASVAAVTAAVTMIPPMYVPSEVPEVAAYVETTESLPALMTESDLDPTPVAVEDTTSASATSSTVDDLPTSTTAEDDATATSVTEPESESESESESGSGSGSTTTTSSGTPTTTKSKNTTTTSQRTTTTAGATTTTTAAVTTTTIATTTTTEATTTTVAPNPPSANNDVGIVILFGSTTVYVLSNDSAGDAPLDASTLSVTSPPSRGSATVSGNSIVYNGGGLIGATSFTYQICDTNGLCDSATATITIVLSL